MKIVILDGYTTNPGDLSWERITELGDVTFYDRTSKENIVERCVGANVIITNKVLITEDIMSQLPDLKYIGLFSTGTNTVDLVAAKKRNIGVANVPGYSTNSVSQMVFSMILDICYRVRDHSNTVHQGDWAASVDFCYWKHPIVELYDKTIGIIGYGSIGRAVANIARAFGMKVLIYNRTKHEDINEDEWRDFYDLLKESDFVTIHCPLTDENKYMINLSTLQLMKPSAYIINTSRGPLINEADLSYVLDNNIIAGAALDVMEKEPPLSSNPLLKNDKCLITPHIAWASKESRSRLIGIVADNISSYFSGKPINIVNK